MLRRQDVLTTSPPIIDNVSKAFSEMLTIVADVSTAYYSAIHRLDQGTAKFDIYSRFGHHMESFRTRVRLCTYEIWRAVLDHNNEDPDQVLVLQAWLAPQDSVLAMLSSDHVNLVSRPDEFTCSWMQPYLNEFFKGNDNCLFIQGDTGSGKTTLANWVIERLQRPVVRKNVSTLSFFFSRLLPSISSYDK